MRTQLAAALRDDERAREAAPRHHAAATGASRRARSTRRPSARRGSSRRTRARRSARGTSTRRHRHVLVQVALARRSVVHRARRAVVAGPRRITPCRQASAGVRTRWQRGRVGDARAHRTTIARTSVRRHSSSPGSGKSIASYCAPRLEAPLAEPRWLIARDRSRRQSRVMPGMPVQSSVSSTSPAQLCVTLDSASVELPALRG